MATPYISLILLILATPYTLPVADNNDAIKRLSASSKKLQDGASRYEKLPINYCIATGIKTEKDQPQRLYICGFYPSKLSLHLQMLPSLAYIIKLLKITIKMKTGTYFLLHVYLYVLCSYKLVF